AADLIQLNRAFLGGTLVSRPAWNAIMSPRMHDGLTDSTSPRRGYEVVIFPATASIFSWVCLSCISGGGEDDEGLHAGFIMNDFVSPEAGSQWILIDNDTGYFNVDTAITFHGLISTRLYGKARGLTPVAPRRAPATQHGSGAQLDTYLT